MRLSMLTIHETGRLADAFPARLEIDGTAGTAEHDEETWLLRDYPWDTPLEEIKTQLSGANAPDLIEMGSSWVPDLADHLEDVSAIVSPNTIAESFDPAVMRLFQSKAVPGRALALPFTLDVRCLVASAQAARRAEKSGWVTGRFFTDLAAFRLLLQDARTHMTRPLVLSKAPADRPCQDVLPLVAMFGGRFWDEDGRPQFASESTVEALVHIAELFATGLAVWGTSRGHITSDVRDGLVAVAPLTYKTLLSGGHRKCDAVPYLPPPDHQPVIFAGGTCVGVVSKTDRSPEKTRRIRDLLLDWLLDADCIAEMARVLRFMPAHKEALAAMYREDPNVWPFFLGARFGTGVTPQVPGAFEMEHVISASILEAIAARDRDIIVQVMEDLQARIEYALSLTQAMIAPVSDPLRDEDDWVASARELMDARECDLVISGAKRFPLVLLRDKAGVLKVPLQPALLGLLLALAMCPSGADSGVLVDPYSYWVSDGADPVVPPAVRASARATVARQLGHMRDDLPERVLSHSKGRRHYAISPGLKLCILVPAGTASAALLSGYERAVRAAVR
ncbi:MAG: hypothetical protein KBI47_05775 [Armatimonadetes bacterium]|nr:hypothetical protein [Armatimonadota bacterium]MDI9585510.1 hypothetical protein [Acidobacteriota bacterium]